LEKDSETFPSFFFNVFLFFLFLICNDGKQKQYVEKEYIKIWWMKGREIKIKYANGGRRTENKI
jgi:hypothetical protein